MGLTGGKCLIKIIFHIKFEIDIFEILNVPNFNLSTFSFGTNLGWAGGKYLTKIIFDIKIEIGIFEISHVPNFNKFWAFLILGPFLDLTHCKYFIKVIFEIIWAINNSLYADELHYMRN